MAFGQQQQPLSAQIVLRHDLGGGGFTALRLGEPERFIEQGQGLKTLIGNRQRNQRSVEPVRTESSRRGLSGPRVPSAAVRVEVSVSVGIGPILAGG